MPAPPETWAPRFEGAFSQLIDWLWKLEHMRNTGDLEHTFRPQLAAKAAALSRHHHRGLHGHPHPCQGHERAPIGSLMRRGYSIVQAVAFTGGVRVACSKSAICAARASLNPCLPRQRAK